MASTTTSSRAYNPKYFRIYVLLRGMRSYEKNSVDRHYEKTMRDSDDAIIAITSPAELRSLQSITGLSILRKTDQ